ncbi:hypothetical protein DACRYDRAFT_96413 [Dacryopinax primogenitus]|uniref:RBR-type E3 ubiquitin transferase n=1 Tax=Dacryopinax primogenitus (strain DJM 731) TaxID=1858805 RepID=M5FPL1_DACPD|nr:uncharacterized protein DACRYDRAFT_96413 [Dacryopinax primogenitus]EJT98640.1 hypothetical protein DACRYDRAFT_96413 [Dacryopinax primogenitus]
MEFQTERMEVRCPITSCGNVLEFEDVKRCAEKSVFERYDKFLLNRHLATEEEFVWCHDPKCGSGYFIPSSRSSPSPSTTTSPSSIITISISAPASTPPTSIASPKSSPPSTSPTQCPLIHCPTCQSPTCAHHLRPWHSNMTCAQYDRQQLGLGPLGVLGKQWRQGTKTGWWIKRKTKPCPGCGIKIERSEGCDHITCYPPAGCGYHFCWRCSANYTLIFQVGNHAHKRFCRHWRSERGSGWRLWRGRN